MKIVFASHTFHHPYFVVGSHHLARQLARRGHTVWHISPIPLFHILNPRLKDRRIRSERFSQGVIRLEPNLNDAVIRPLLPWQLTRLFLRFGNFFLRLSGIKSLVAVEPELQNVDVLLIDEPRLLGINHYIKASATFYRPTDLYADLKSDPSINRAEALLLKGCRGLIATSQPVLEHVLQFRPSIPHLLLTNGADMEHFSTPRPAPIAFQGIASPRVIYAGAIDKRLDLELIQTLAHRFPSINFVLIGNGAEFAQAQALRGSNIYVLGFVPYNKLNAYLQHAEIGLLPLKSGQTNDGRSPMKLYEYGMAGLAVLARKTSELERRKESFIDLYSNFQEAEEALRTMLSRVRNRKQIQEACAKHSWEQKAQTLENFIVQTPHGGSDDAPESTKASC